MDCRRHRNTKNSLPVAQSPKKLVEGRAIQLGFTLRTSASVKTVHLLGSWDNYAGQLPLARDKNSSEAGAWKGTFRFGGATLKAGQRHWYYYIIDGYHVSHSPAQPSTTEPTTGRVLNIRDIPSASSKSSSGKHPSSSRREARAASTAIPKVHPLSVSQIVSPKPISPHATKAILETLEAATVADLTSRLSETTLNDEDDSDFEGPQSMGSSLSSRSDLTLSSCACERYGITRSGERIKLDCGGSRCGYFDESSCFSSDDEE